MITMTAKERAAVAQAVRMHDQYLYQCLTGRRPTPAERCPDIERATQARVTCEQLRPDVRWLRVPDPHWPHVSGRPCIDAARPSNEEGVS